MTPELSSDCVDRLLLECDSRFFSYLLVHQRDIPLKKSHPQVQRKVCTYVFNIDV